MEMLNAIFFTFYGYINALYLFCDTRDARGVQHSGKNVRGRLDDLRQRPKHDDNSRHHLSAPCWFA